MARTLTAVGVPTMRAHDLARRVEEDLRARGETVADLTGSKSSRKTTPR